VQVKSESFCRSSSDRIRRVNAVVQHSAPGGVASDFLVLTKCLQQIDVKLERRVLFANRLAQGNENRMQRLFAMAPAVAQILFPGAEQLKRTRRIVDFVADIVRPAAVGVDVVEVLVQLARQQPRNDTEILVVVRGQPARVALRFFDAAAQRRQVTGDFEFGRRQHFRYVCFSLD